MIKSSPPDLSLGESIESLRDHMIHHPVFTAIRDIEGLRSFMEAHVFAVWDFMSLVKRLQRDLTCVTLPWLPPRDRRAAQLINQIVLGEETDVGPAGEPISHLEIYLAAMREIGANTTKFETFQAALAKGADLSAAFDKAAIEPFIRDFTSYTLRTAREAPSFMVMASFFHGREDVIPLMFDNLLRSWGMDAAKAPMFVYYLKRHIELDGDEHGPAAECILNDAIDGDPERRRQVALAAQQSIQARIGLWDGLLACLHRRRPARDAVWSIASGAAPDPLRIAADRPLTRGGTNGHSARTIAEDPAR
ncbi:MAG: DUF3050 domain-containing protein [Stellaceae bacterium]